MIYCTLNDQENHQMAKKPDYRKNPAAPAPKTVSPPSATSRNRGGENPNAKLTEEDVVEIRRILREDPLVSQRELAERYGVTQVCISHIHRRNSWKNVL